MGYLSGSISLSLRLRMSTTGLRPGSNGMFRWVEPGYRFTPCNGKGLPNMSSRNVAVGTKLG